MTVYLGDKAVGVNTIVEKEVPKVKFGATIDTFLGDVDENGVLQRGAEQIDLVFSDVKELADSAIKYIFYDRQGIRSVKFPDLVSSTIDGCSGAFTNCESLVTAEMPKLRVISKGFASTFSGCSGLSSIDLSGLEEISGTSATSSMFANTGVVEVNLGALKTINASNSCSAYMFDGCKSLVDVNLGNLTTVGGSYACQYMFRNCTALKSVNVSSLQEISGNNSMNYMFYGCTSLEFINLSSIKKLNGDGSVNYMFFTSGLVSVDISGLETIEGIRASTLMFASCAKLESITYDSLTTITGQYSFSSVFSGCVSLARASFPSLVNVSADSWSATTFQNCSALTEIHFRADVQAAIEATTGYSSKWGATNATIYFDL